MDNENIPENTTEEVSPEKPEAPPEDKKNKKKSRRQMKKEQKAEAEKAEQLMRIEQLEKYMADHHGEVDPDTVVSMYMPQRKAKRFGAALLRLDKLRLILLALTALVAIIFIFAFMQEKMGNFTINLNRLELYRKGISISADSEFTDATAKLTADVVKDATNISIDDLPDNLDDLDGNHNGTNYMAYTYYVRNAGKEDVGYKAVVKLEACAKGAEKAVRVAVYRNGEKVVYAAPAADGGKEDGCENFYDENTVCLYTEEEFLVGNVDKYTIVIWMEGDDPECVDSIVGGSVQFSMSIDSIYEDDTNLIVKFWRDLVDSFKGDQAINADGISAPNYYNSGNLTWGTRRNQNN